MNVPSLEAGRTFLHQETVDHIVFRLGPDDRHVGYRPAGNPHFFAVQDVAITLAHRPRKHPAGIRAELRLSQAETTQGFAFLQLGQPFVFLRVAAVGVNGVHHQRALHRDETAQSGIPSLQLLSHQAVLHIGHSRAAVALQTGSEKAQLAHLRHQVARENALAVVLFDDGQHLLVNEGARRLPHQLLVAGQQGIEINEIHTRKTSHQNSPRALNQAELRLVRQGERSPRPLPRKEARCNAKQYCFDGS